MMYIYDEKRIDVNWKLYAQRIIIFLPTIIS